MKWDMQRVACHKRRIATWSGTAVLYSKASNKGIQCCLLQGGLSHEHFQGMAQNGSSDCMIQCKPYRIGTGVD